MRESRVAAGFTLVELLLALGISSIIMGAVYAFYVSQQRHATAQQDIALVQQDLRAAMQIMERDVRMAGYDPTSAGIFGYVLNGTFSVEAVSTTSTQLACTMDIDGDGTIDLAAQDVDGNGSIDLREIEQVAYRVNANRLQRYSTTTGIVRWQDVAENIEAIEFWYQLADTTWTLAPTAAQLPNIRSVRISLLVRARQPDHGFFNPSVYVAASGTAFNGGLPYNDNLRRRLLIQTVECRNMGL